MDIAEKSLTECKRIEAELVAIKAQVQDVIRHVDALSVVEKECRYNLMIVSKNIKEYSETDIRNAYEKAKDSQVKLAARRSEEHQLIEKRSELERRYKVYKETADKAESLVSRVSVVMDYLGGGLKDISDQIEDIKQKKDIGIRIIRAQEEERKRLAREIHDGPAQTMANLVMKAEICEKLIEIDPEKAKRELSEFRGTVRSGLGDIRKIIYDLRPMSLDDLGLIPSVQKLISDFGTENGTTVELKTNMNGCILAPEIEIALFRIIQESLTNIKKHAKAKHVIVRFEIQQTGISLLITDDGVGFNPDEERKPDVQGGYGLISMRERTELLSGRFNIHSSPSVGTRILVAIPLDMEEN